jgi:hypothetical protein
LKDPNVIKKIVSILLKTLVSIDGLSEFTPLMKVSNEDNLEADKVLI